MRNQVEMVMVMVMVMRDLDSLLPEDHLARAIWEVVESLDLSAFYAPIKAVIGEPGHPATGPQVLVALWIYATAEGVGRARQLDRLCHEHDACRWLCSGVPINYHMVSDFRVAHRDALDALMTRILAAMMAEGLVRLDRVAQDGMRVRASAGAGSFRREGKLKEKLGDHGDIKDPPSEQGKPRPERASHGEPAAAFVFPYYLDYLDGDGP